MGIIEELLGRPMSGPLTEIGFPMGLGVEVTNVCNLTCIMCPREQAQRGFDHMDFALFERIVEEAARYPDRAFLPQGFGESLLHPRWPEMMALLHQKRISPIFLITNGTLLTPRNIDVLLGSGITVIAVSIDGVEDETFRKVRGGNLSKVRRGVQDLLAAKKARGGLAPHIVLRIIRMKYTEDEIERFREEWTPLLNPGDEIAVSNFNTWGGKYDPDEFGRSADAFGAQQVGPLSPCRMLWRNLQIYWNGDVTPCCYDDNCEMWLGNVKEQSIAEIFNGPLMRKYREIHLRREFSRIKVCAACAEYVP